MATKEIVREIISKVFHLAQCHSSSCSTFFSCLLTEVLD